MIRTTDAQSFLQNVSEPEISSVLPNSCLPKTLREAEQELMYWANLHLYNSGAYWAVTNSQDRMIGLCGFNYWHIENRRAEIAYELASEYWGKGIMSSAVNVISDFAFTKMHLCRIQATVMPSNHRSLRLLDRCGYVREGLMKEYKSINGVNVDHYMYARCASD